MVMMMYNGFGLSLRDIRFFSPYAAEPLSRDVSIDPRLADMGFGFFLIGSEYNLEAYKGAVQQHNT